MVLFLPFGLILGGLYVDVIRGCCDYLKTNYGPFYGLFVPDFVGQFVIVYGMFKALFKGLFRLKIWSVKGLFGDQILGLV